METQPPPPPDPFGTLGPRFDPSMAIIMVVLVSVFFLMGFFSIYIRQCAQRHIRPNNTTDPYLIFLAGNNRRSRRAARGLEASVINTFPTFLYSAVKGLKIGKESLECAVCLNEFEDEETLRLIPKCSHVFHPDCIDAWLASHTTCPVCRANLVPEPGEIISSYNVQLLNPDSDLGEPVQRSDDIEEISQVDAEQRQRRDVESLDGSWSNQNRPPRSRSSGWRLSSLFPRSHSTGHSLVQQGENCERFTLRLPEEVQSELIMKSSLNRSKSCVAFPRVRSSRKGFRSGSGSLGLPRNHYSFKPDRFGFSITPPFILRTGSVRSPKEMLMPGTATPPPKTLFKSLKSKSSSLLVGRDCDAQTSFERLRPDDQV
ncbi:hypothetical protein JRO89_XS07G0126800 [Xanthoceras sorbifolium]|uniref:RING-type E3 ubiquitin transferase n=1 Tax=Xanthoceras sorbifolium TaxID=99658 RepID=A0ABQ8HTT7_9ROSI|nr:hypothetical protein JRO89_XS07G0126800 [Xanthoceras sorbifolium]